MCARSLKKAIQATVRIREFMLGTLKPHTHRNPLLQLELIHPGIFAPAALDAAVSILKAALDSHSVRDHAGRVPFQAPRRSFAFSSSPRRHQQRSDSVRHHWSLPPTVSAIPQSFSFLKGNGWGAVLADFERHLSEVPPAPQPGL